MWEMLRELDRENELNRYQVIDTDKDPGFARFVQRIATGFDAPFVLLSLARGDRLWFKATAGIDIASMPKCDTFCSHILDRDSPLEVCDASADETFRHLAVVTGEPGIRYYLGVRLRVGRDVGMGALCVLDRVVRPPASPEQRAFLLAVARQAEALLELRASLLLERAA